MLVAADAAFNGKIVVSVKRITAGMATFALKNSSGTVVYEQRAGASNTNIFQGVNAGRLNTTGGNNVFQGFSAGMFNTSGQYNVFIGPEAGMVNSTANQNVFIGRAGLANTTGADNFFLGFNAGISNVTGGANVFIGSSAGRNSTASNNIFLGSAAAFSLTSGLYNTFIGSETGRGLTGGSSNTLMGRDAGRYIGTGTTNTLTMSQGLLLGADSRTLGDGETGSIVIGAVSRGLGSNTTVIGNSSTTRAKIWGSLENQSSGTTTGTSLLIQNTTPVELLKVLDNGKTSFATTNTAAGTTGAQTINKASGTVNFAAAATSLVVTNSLCTTSSIVFAVIRNNDATAWIENVVPAAGSFTINLGAAATAETSVGFFIIN
jgi:hypothetical protein